jgi:predicted deacylase
MPAVVDDLDLAQLERCEIHRMWITLAQDAAGRDTNVPVIVARGRRDGPVFGITAAVHGNELNGIPIIHRLMANVVPNDLKGTIVAVPVVNLPGYLNHRREHPDGMADLNRLMPGKQAGNVSEQYAACFVERVVDHLDYLVDLHTASFGRVNSLYIRADMTHAVTARLARLVSPQIIVHTPGKDGTLRGYAEDRGIAAMTVEVGDPQRFQGGLIRSSRLGLQAVLDELDMYDHDDDPVTEAAIECTHSYWIYTREGGVLRVLPQVAERVSKGQLIATITDLFGNRQAEYLAPEDGVVVGKSTNPAAGSGARILHLGIPGHIEPTT